ncbi:MAG: hypothetical protein QUU85_12385, partial [Candidatus Eisenbacteria bacterium]|nr:hypothetical protein [Candidatus Eisenbacteria bacterium]
MAGAKKRRSDVKRQPQPPARLPAEYREVWLALHDAQRSSPSRQALARRLGISTATLQRLLVRGDVPPFPSTRSVRVRRAWARTLGRLAMRLGHDPAAWIEKVGIPAGDAQPALARHSSRRAAARTEGEPANAQARPVPLPPGATIAAAILRRGISASVPGAAAIDEFLEAFLRRLLGAADPSSTVEIHRVTESEARENLLGSASAAAILCGVVPRAEIARAGGWMLRIPGIRLTSGALRLADRSKP